MKVPESVCWSEFNCHISYVCKRCHSPCTQKCERQVRMYENMSTPTHHQHACFCRFHAKSMLADIDARGLNVRPHYRRFGLTPLAAGLRTRRLQVGLSVISRLAWRGPELLERSSTHRRPPRQSAASVFIRFPAHKLSAVGRRSFVVH
jgi:hypothetical protein